MKSFLLVITLAAVLQGRAQSDKAAAISSLVASQNYVFKPTTVLPQSGQTRQLNSDYSLAVTTAAIISDLPYFGRAYSAIDPSKGPMSFTSKSFDYATKPLKKGGWDITIKPKDMRDDVQQIYLTISTDGYATLRVVSSNRDGISYSGQIVSPK